MKNMHCYLTRNTRPSPTMISSLRSILTPLPFSPSFYLIIINCILIWMIQCPPYYPPFIPLSHTFNRLIWGIISSHITYSTIGMFWCSSLIVLGHGYRLGILRLLALMSFNSLRFTIISTFSAMSFYHYPKVLECTIMLLYIWNGYGIIE